MTERQYGITGTVIMHAILLLILIFSYITLSKPSPSEGGILINFGDVESAAGPTEPAVSPQQSQAASAPAVEPDNAEEGMLTQEFEEAPAVKKPAVKKPVKPAVKPVTKPVVKATTPVVPKEPTVNKKALYTSKSTAGKSTTGSGSSEGIYKGTGNMGSPTGSTESDNYSQGLGGNGIGFDLTGRSPVHLPKPAFNVQKDGIIVVEITVDRSGRVISAQPGVKGSTLVDNTLYASAKKAALESKFNVKNDAPELQIGKITYHFKLQ
jgi:outer membrane biosynthesis protein TonB